MKQQAEDSTFDAILFDLDGTLLRVQMTEFIPRYVEGLAELCRDYVKQKKFIRVMLGGIRSLIQHHGDGVMTNEQRLHSMLQQHLAIPEAALRNCFQRYAEEQLESLRDLVRPIPLAREILAQCQQFQVPLVLATNPVFPEFMIQARLRWGGLSDIPFQHMTSVENSCYCKPQSDYFREIARHLGVQPERCLMVGNDTLQDLAAASVGMKTFLVDTWVVEREGAGWPCDHRGDHGALQRFLQTRRF
ncbi:HAD family hydrolase [Malonomonas rubra]|uniref:HAD family hydrolase n=1 Tax=Malonomonas rubra TaxID=57040 RepID=UPI0026EB93A4|nr:HAD family hydrolase [Malonomonas rubra]